MRVALGSLIGVHGNYGTPSIIFFDPAYAQRLVRVIIIQYHSCAVKDVYTYIYSMHMQKQINAYIHIHVISNQPAIQRTSPKFNS